jgi:DnaJ-class molecular chaperone
MQAVLGCEFFINTIYGKRRKVKAMAGTQVGDRIQLPGEGFYRLNSEEKGSHYVNLKI